MVLLFSKKAKSIKLMPYIISVVIDIAHGKIVDTEGQQLPLRNGIEVYLVFDCRCRDIARSGHPLIAYQRAAGSLEIIQATIKAGLYIKKNIPHFNGGGGRKWGLRLFLVI